MLAQPPHLKHSRHAAPRNESTDNKIGFKRAYISEHGARCPDHSQQNRQGWPMPWKITPVFKKGARASLIPRNDRFQVQSATGLSWKTFQSQFWENIQQSDSKTSVLNATSVSKENAYGSRFGTTTVKYAGPIHNLSAACIYNKTTSGFGVPPPVHAIIKQNKAKSAPTTVALMCIAIEPEERCEHDDEVQWLPSIQCG